jgi:hypothetical protein
MWRRQQYILALLLYWYKSTCLLVQSTNTDAGATPFLLFRPSPGISALLDAGRSRWEWEWRLSAPCQPTKKKFRIDENSVIWRAGDWLEYYCHTALCGCGRGCGCGCGCGCACACVRTCTCVCVCVCVDSQIVFTQTRIHTDNGGLDVVHTDTRRRKIQTRTRTPTNRVSCIHRSMICAARRMQRELWHMQILKRRMHSAHADTVVRMQIPSPDATAAEI